MKYYHMTQTKNVKDILRNGLKCGLDGRVWLGGRPEDCVLLAPIMIEYYRTYFWAKDLYNRIFPYPCLFEWSKVKTDATIFSVEVDGVPVSRPWMNRMIDKRAFPFDVPFESLEEFTTNRDIPRESISLFGRHEFYVWRPLKENNTERQIRERAERVNLLKASGLTEQMIKQLMLPEEIQEYPRFILPYIHEGRPPRFPKTTPKHG